MKARANTGWMLLPALLLTTRHESRIANHEFDSRTTVTAMPIDVTAFHHTNVRVPRALESATKHFYSSILGLKEVPKPVASGGKGGAWYQIGSNQIHLSVDDTANNRESKRHICLLVADLEQTKVALIESGVAVIPDPEPSEESPRFYVRDPGDNLIEIAQTRD